MAKALKVIGAVAGVVATVAKFIPGGQAVAAIAGAVSVAASIGGSLIGVKPPPARGSLTEAIIEVDPPASYAMGEGYFAGVKRHHAGYGPTIKKVPNPYLWEVYALSIGGPVEGPITPQFDFGPPGSFYNGFFEYDSKLGAVPDTALTAAYGSPTRWGGDYKLSGTACIGYNHQFDREGERYASGLPTRGAIGKWVKVYDPRLDDTFPGGVGSHRLGDESTYEWSENPALHAGTYAYGRYQNGKRVFGMGLPVEAIGFESVAAWANDCDANGWAIFGVVFEGSGITPGQRWQNLRDICIAGGAEPLPLYTGIGFHWDRPRVVLDTITEADVAGEIDATGMQSYRDRINTIVPEYVSEAHFWERIKAEPIVNSVSLAEDGEPNTTVFPFNFVKGSGQAGQLAAYKLSNARELYPLEIDLMPRLRAYRPGDCLQLDIPSAGLNTPAVMVTRQVDPATGAVKAVFIGETSTKHAYALGETAVPPVTPFLGQDAEARDKIAAAANREDLLTLQIAGSYTVGLAGNVTFTDSGTDITVGIPAHIRRYAGSIGDIAVDAGTLSIPYGKSALVFYDEPEPDAASSAQTYQFVVPGENGAERADAYFSTANPERHFVAFANTPAADGSGGTTGGSGPPGSGGWDGDNGEGQVP